jgi:hypothetical protein
MVKTMIQLEKRTVLKLQELKSYPRETYDELINKLIDYSNTDLVSEQELNEIEQGLADIRKGRVQSIESIAKKLKVKL